MSETKRGGGELLIQKENEIKTYEAHDLNFKGEGYYVFQRLLNDYGSYYGDVFIGPCENLETAKKVLKKTGEGEIRYYLQQPDDQCQCDGCRGISDVWNQTHHESPENYLK